MQTLKFACEAITPIALRLHAKEDAKHKSRTITSLLEHRYGIPKTDTLSQGEISLLGEIVKGRKLRKIAKLKNVRRDTVSRQLALAREKLGLKSNKELMCALRPYQNT